MDVSRGGLSMHPLAIIVFPITGLSYENVTCKDNKYYGCYNTILYAPGQSSDVYIIYITPMFMAC